MFRRRRVMWARRRSLIGKSGRRLVIGKIRRATVARQRRQALGRPNTSWMVCLSCVGKRCRVPAAFESVADGEDWHLLPDSECVWGRHMAGAWAASRWLEGLLEVQGAQAVALGLAHFLGSITQGLELPPERQRAAARRLAGEKFEVCRHCLDYLPYAECRTRPGAWLANATRDEYGPPKRYMEAKAVQEREAQAATVNAMRESREAERERLRERNRDLLRSAYRQMEAEGGDRMADFLGFLESERVKALRIANNLSEARRQQHLAAFDEQERRLELFGKWLRTTDPVSPQTVRAAASTRSVQCG